MTYKEQLTAIMDRQIEKGKSKYGVTLEDADLYAVELINHALEEIVDQAMYMLALRDGVAKLEYLANLGLAYQKWMHVNGDNWELSDKIIPKEKELLQWAKGVE